MAQLIPIVSDALQSTVRRLLPSQSGFGEDLQASNVIIPVIDLTGTAEGSQIGTNLQTAFSFADVNSFAASNGTDVIANTPGFWRIFAAVNVKITSGSNPQASFTMSDGLSVKTLWNAFYQSASTDTAGAYALDFVVYLNAGESISCTTNDLGAKITGSAIQIADTNGNLSNPAGFNPQ